MNAVNNETDNALKQSSSDCMETPATENKDTKSEPTSKARQNRKN